MSSTNRWIPNSSLDSPAQIRSEVTDVNPGTPEPMKWLDRSSMLRTREESDAHTMTLGRRQVRTISDRYLPLLARLSVGEATRRHSQKAASG